MTYSDIYTKFLIEYDKQNITSSYPSLTVYEIATLLDKAYLALIAQKLTGNNPRRAPFEIDIKAIEDLRPLIVTKEREKKVIKADTLRTNVYRFPLNKTGDPDFLYYIQSSIDVTIESQNEGADVKPRDSYTPEEDYINTKIMKDPVQIINHSSMDNFIKSSVNIPWIKTPVGCLEGDEFLVMVDPFAKYERNKVYGNLNLTYIKRPKPFVGKNDNTTNFSTTPPTEFELSDTMAEELINLAIVMALETVESPRIQTKEQTRALES